MGRATLPHAYGRTESSTGSEDIQSKRETRRKRVLMSMLHTRSDTGTERKDRWDNRLVAPALFIIASLMDVATTWYALKYTTAIEGNPFMRSIAESVPLMLCVKALGFLLIVCVIRYTISFPHWHPWIWVSLSLLTFAAVINNIIVIGV